MGRQPRGMEESNKKNILGFNMSEFGLGTQGVMLSYQCANHSFGRYLRQVVLSFPPGLSKSIYLGLLEVFHIPVLWWNHLTIVSYPGSQFGHFHRSLCKKELCHKSLRQIWGLLQPCKNTDISHAALQRISSSRSILFYQQYCFRTICIN